MNDMSMRAVGVRALVAVTAAATFTVVAPSTTVLAAPATAAMAAKAEDVKWVTKPEDRIKAFSVVNADADAEPALLTMTDRDFVLEIWKRAKPAPAGVGLSEVHAAAEIALMNGQQDGYVAFIISGIHDAKRADIDKQITTEQAARQTRELRRTAAAHAKIEVTDTNLLLSERDFIFEVLTKAPGARVRAAAEQALRGTAEQQHEFITAGVLTAAEQDVQDELDKIAKEELEKRAKLQSDQARRNALGWLGDVATDGQLAMTDEAFLHVVWNKAEAVDHDEITAAVVKALRTQDPATFRACIDTGIADAARTKIKKDLEAKAAADKKAAKEVQRVAESKFQRNLAMSAKHALANGPDAVDEFLRIGQYQVPSDDANHPGAGVWQWRNVNSGRCLGIEAESTANGTKIAMRNCNGPQTDHNDKWFAMRVAGTGGEYRFVYAYDTSKCMTLPADATDGRLILWTCGAKPGQKWYYAKNGTDYRWATKDGNKVLGVAGASKADKAAVVAPDSNNTAVDRQWRPSQDSLLVGMRLKPGQVLESADASARLQNQTDGNLVLHDVKQNNKAVWHTNTWKLDPSNLLNQPDGNLVMYDVKTDKPVWDSKTYTAGASTLVVQNDANVVLYTDKDQKSVWHTNTWRR
jgi:hypothetical protein